jgi:hypothetical protein
MDKSQTQNHLLEEYSQNWIATLKKRVAEEMQSGEANLALVRRFVEDNDPEITSLPYEVVSDGHLAVVSHSSNVRALMQELMRIAYFKQSGLDLRTLQADHLVLRPVYVSNRIDDCWVVDDAKAPYGQAAFSSEDHKTALAYFLEQIRSVG